MKCKQCSKKIVCSEPSLCKDHFIEYVENTVIKKIKQYKLIKKKDKIVVAVSGGKDSISVLYILSKYFDNVEGIAID